VREKAGDTAGIAPAPSPLGGETFVSFDKKAVVGLQLPARRRCRRDSRALLAAANVKVNRPAVEAGLAVLEAGGDFADGVIAYEGAWLGGETFVSFDKKAVTLLMDQGHSAGLL
jgi:hypothetical protein